jgi:hypothetical protein
LLRFSGTAAGPHDLVLLLLLLLLALLLLSLPPTTG